MSGVLCLPRPFDQVSRWLARLSAARGALVARVALVALVGAAGVLWAAPTAHADGDGAATFPGLVSTGPDHSCALLDPGKVRCWGRNQAGELGNGSREGIGDGIGADLDDADNLALGSKATMVAVGDQHSCALVEAGAVKCWGKGDDQRLGYTSTANVGDSPRRAVRDGSKAALSGAATAIAAGGDATCAVLTTGSVECWGRQRLPRSVALPGKAAAVAVSSERGCAVLESGDVHCWRPAGGATKQPLGDAASRVAVSSTYGCVLLTSAQPECWTEDSDPMPIPIDEPVIDLAVGGDRACAVSSSAAVWCWEAEGEPRETGVDAVAVSVGDDAVCAVTSQQRLHCWGDGAWGQLGTGDVDSRTVDGAVVAVASGSTAETITSHFGGKAPTSAADAASTGGGLSPWWFLILIPVIASGAALARIRSRSSHGGTA